MMTQEEININHEICLELLDKFLDICENNKIKYTLSYGSVLGAVRHKGFIPWDINIDMLLSVDEFYRLDRIMKSEKLNDMEWICPTENGRIHSLLVRRDSGNFRSYPNIDIAVFANASDIKVLRKLQFKIAYLNIKMFKIKNTRVDRTFPFNILKRIASFFPNSFYYHILHKLEMFKINSQTKYQFDTTPAHWKEGQLMETKWLWSDTPNYGIFEGRRVRLPADYDSFLKTAYGPNYMTPIVWESKGVHFHAKKK